MSMTTLPSAPPIAIRRRPEAALFMRTQLESPRRNLGSRRAPSATCIRMIHVGHGVAAMRLVAGDMATGTPPVDCEPERARG
jgi:hypothetical protein